MNLNSKQTFNLTLSINPELHTDTDSNPNLKYNPELTSTQPQTHNSTQNLTLTETGCTLNPKPNANILPPQPGKLHRLHQFHLQGSQDPPCQAHLPGMNLSVKRS